MSGECNYCGGPHAEAGCDADRELVYGNGYAAGEAAGLNEASERTRRRYSDVHAERERVRALLYRTLHAVDRCITDGRYLSPGRDELKDVAEAIDAELERMEQT